MGETISFRDQLRDACGDFAVIGSVSPDASVKKLRLRERQAVQVSTRRNAILHKAHKARADHEENYFLICQLSGSAQMIQGRSATLQAGDFFLATSRHESEFVYPDGSVQLSLHLPHFELSEVIGRALRNGRHFVGDSVIGRALARACGAPGRALEIEDLLAVGIHSGAAPDLSLADAAIRLSARRAGDPTLAPGVLADDLGVTLRSLQRALGAQGLTAGSVILDHRLRRAAHLLAERPDLTILACATEAGFADVSGFNRVFRRERGMTPGQFRKNACRDSPRRV